MSKYRPRTAAEKARDNAAAKKRRDAKNRGQAKQDRAAATKRVAKARPARPAKASGAATNGHGSRTAYRLVDGIPETPKAGTTGRIICETLQAAGQATIPEIMAANPSAPGATVRKWIHMLRQVKAVKSVPAKSAAA